MLDHSRTACKGGGKACLLPTSTLYATGKGPITADQAKYVFAGKEVVVLLVFVADPEGVVLGAWPAAGGATSPKS